MTGRNAKKVSFPRRRHIESGKVHTFRIDIFDKLSEQLGGFTLGIVLDGASLGLRRVERDNPEVEHKRVDERDVELGIAFGLVLSSSEGETFFDRRGKVGRLLRREELIERRAEIGGREGNGVVGEEVRGGLSLDESFEFESGLEGIGETDSSVNGEGAKYKVVKLDAR